MTEAPQVPAVEIISPKVVKWAERITHTFGKAVFSVLETGKELLKAKADCDHGEWQQLVGKPKKHGLLPFKRTFSFMLMKIALCERIVQHAEHLPSDSTTLYYLTRLTDQRFGELLKNKTINPSMKRNEASAETRKEKKEEDERRILSVEPAPGKHRTIIIDPPWDYEWLSIAGRAQPGYATMTHEELLALDVAAWADENCHLYLWTTNNFITRACELMAHWGFQHKTVLTWVKPKWGLGSYLRNSTEHVLIGECGHMATRVDDIATHFEAPLGEHSEKPEKFYQIVKRLSYPPYGEAFQRKERDWINNLFREQEAAA